MNACTIVSRRQLPLAQELAHAFREQHPAAAFTTIVVDGLRGHDAGADDLVVITPDALPIDGARFLDMAFIYHEAELIRALKPYALRHLVEKFRAPALYLAPEVAVYASLDD
ncbi:MAG TPA: hypothetical protein VGZ52_12665, partial [Acidimicrobiales bacterium]|nr:hypothetical protein [Acidimicrobiales bacterium]